MTLVDTNVLLRAIQRDNSSFRAAARTAIKTLLRRGEPICVTPQNLIEFWNVCTRPFEVNGLGMNIAEVDRGLLRCESFFTVLPEGPAVFPEWKRLVRAFGVSGLKVHDARLVASMNVQGVKSILTFDVKDFERYPDITVVDPTQVGP